MTRPTLLLLVCCMAGAWSTPATAEPPPRHCYPLQGIAWIPQHFAVLNAEEWTPDGVPVVRASPGADVGVFIDIDWEDGTTNDPIEMGFARIKTATDGYDCHGDWILHTDWASSVMGEDAPADALWSLEADDYSVPWGPKQWSVFADAGWQDWFHNVYMPNQSTMHEHVWPSSYCDDLFYCTDDPHTGQLGGHVLTIHYKHSGSPYYGPVWITGRHINNGSVTPAPGSAWGWARWP